MHAVFTPEFVQQLILGFLGLMTIVLGVCTPLITMHVRRTAKKMAEAAGVTIQESQLKQLDELVITGIGAAEEYAHNAAKSGLAYTPHEKLDHAVQVARDLAKDGLQSWTDEQLRSTVEAKLPVARAKMSTPPPPA